MKRFFYLLALLLLSVSDSWAADEITAFRLSSENGLPDNNIRYIWQDSVGRMCFLSSYAAYQYDGYSYRPLPAAQYEKLKQQSRKGVARKDGSMEDNRGNSVSIRADGWLDYWHAKTGRHITLQVFDARMLRLTDNLKCRVVTDRRGLVWVSVNGNGLFVYDPRTRGLRHITKSDPQQLIDANNIVYMMEDRDGHVWVSQEHNGVVCLKVTARNHQVLMIDRDRSNEKNNEVRMLRRLSDGTLLIANNAGALLSSTDELATAPVLRQRDGNYLSAARDRQGRLWLGSRLKGVNIEGRWYGNGRIDCLLEDGQGRMWLCGLNGTLRMAKLDEQGRYTERRFTAVARPRTMLLDHQGSIWLGTDSGLYRFRPDELVRDSTYIYKVSDVPVRCLYEDSRRQLWIGTTGRGLMWLDGERPHFLTQQDGLPNNVVQAMAEDSHHRLLIGTEDGCVLYHPESGKMRSLYFHDSRIRNFIHENAAVRLADGRIALGTLDGIVIIRQDVQQEPVRQRPVAITDMLVNGTSVYDMSHPAECVELAHQENTVTIHFSAFDYGGRPNDLFTYRLDGYDHEWSTASRQNVATYKNLSPGRYVFRVRYKNEQGEWSRERQLSMVISPPWWNTWWAWLVYILSVLLLGYVIYRQLRSTFLLRQRIKTEQQLTAFKLRFFTNVSHEFRTPLTLMQGALERIRDQKELPGALRQPVSNMEHSVERMVRLVNQLLEFRRMQEGKLSLSLQETEVVGFLRDRYMHFRDVAESRHISYSFIPSEKSCMVYIDRGFLDKVMYNLLSNAFKYTPSGRSITMALKMSNVMRICVTDTGVGVPKEQRASLFERYAAGQLSADSMGIGLNLTYELVKAHHGTITYEENPEGGSIFTVTLPTDKAVYQEQDFLQPSPITLHESPSTLHEYREVVPNPMNNVCVLVVEDDAEVAEMVSRELGRYFRVLTANDGAEAWELLQADNSPIDLVISDVLMSRMNGFELTRRIRAHQQLRHLPIVLLTALTDETKQEQGLTSGADVYIVKPFSIKLLLAQCCSLIDQRERLKHSYATIPYSSTAAPAEVIRDERDKRFIAQLDVYVASQMHRSELSVDNMAAHFGCGRSTFYQRVRKLTGYTPNDYLKRARMERAAELLRTDNITVSEVCYQVGISSPQYFATSFRKIYGMSPTAYQQGRSV